MAFTAQDVKELREITGCYVGRDWLYSVNVYC